MSCVVCIDSSLIACNEHTCGEVGNVGSYVALSFAKSEVEILAGVLGKILLTKLNASDYNGKTNIGCKVFLSKELIGDIDWLNGLDGGVNDNGSTALELLHAAVRSYLSSDGNGHTNLNSKLCGVNSDAVAVVTAFNLCVCKEEVVVLVAHALRVDSNYDTLNGKLGTVCCCHVVCMRVNSVLVNIAGEGCGSGGTVGCLNGSGKSVGEILIGLLGNVDGNGLAVLGYLYGNLVGVNGPGNSVGCACNSNLGNNVEVCGSGAKLLFVEAFNVLSSGCYIICRLLGLGLFLLACCKNRHAKNKNEQKGKNLFHDCSFFVLFY